MAEIYLAGGCFWGMEKYLASIHGVEQTLVGFANGRTERPTYEDVCHCGTGHAETVRVLYRPETVSLNFLLDLYFKAIDPVSVNRQGGDSGTQYRTGVYYLNASDRPVIERSVARLQQQYPEPVAVEVKPLVNFFPAEAYHQRYLEKNPGGYCHIRSDQIDRAARAVVDPSRYAAPEEATLRKTLTPQQFEVTRRNATELPFQNEYHSTFRPGIYVDITTGEPLFSSRDKFESGCGWPSFSRPVDPGVLKQTADASHGMLRTEVRSRVGDAHLGHVFTDGPKDRGGLRYCINSAALRFIPLGEMEREGYGGLIEAVKEP